MDRAKSFLGVGWSFPVDVDKATGRVRMSDWERDIEEAIKIILGTKRGERVMNPEFGSSLHEFVFSGGDYTTVNRLKAEIIECLTIWEPRITDIEAEVRFLPGAGGFVVNLSYTVRSTNNPYNLVYPYFLTEGIPT